MLHAQNKIHTTTNKNVADWITIPQLVLSYLADFVIQIHPILL